MRIYTSSNAPRDYCRDCVPDDDAETRARHTDGEGPDGRDDCYAYDAEHPPYHEELIHCATCGDELTEED